MLKGIQSGGHGLSEIGRFDMSVTWLVGQGVVIRYSPATT
jgi:hypothetical protein